MEETKTPQNTPMTDSLESYTPSSTEKKRAVMMYLLIGVIVTAFTNQHKTDFEQFHLKQAVGRRSTFLLLIVASAIFVFIPLIKYLPLFMIIVMIAFLAIFIHRARKGKYTIDPKNKLAIFLGLWERILNLFEVKPSETTKSKTNNT